MHGSNADMAVVVIILATRFIVPLFIPRFPLPAILVCLVVDAADQTILQQLTDLSLDNYQNYDKALDIYYLTIAYLAVYRNWTNGIAVEVARFLWYYRLIGVLAFEITQERWLLMVFPNTFEYFFIAYEVVRTCWDPRRMSRRAVIGLAAFIWIFIKLPQEWWIHVAQNDFTDFMKETVFGVDGTDSWGDAFGNRPFVLLAILAGDRRDRVRRPASAQAAPSDRLVVPGRRRPADACRRHPRRRPARAVDAVADHREAGAHRAHRGDLHERARGRGEPVRRSSAPRSCWCWSTPGSATCWRPGASNGRRSRWSSSCWPCSTPRC